MWEPLGIGLGVTLAGWGLLRLARLLSVRSDVGAGGKGLPGGARTWDLEDEESERAHQVVKEWVESGDAGTASLEAALGRGDRDARRHLPDVLRFADHPRKLDWLLRLLADEDEQVRLAAADTLALSRETNDPDEPERSRMVDALIAALDDPEPGVRNLACQGLGNTRDRRAVAPLAAVLAGHGWHAVDALERIGDPAAIAPLRAYYDSLTELVLKSQAWDALFALGVRDIPRPHREGPGFEEICLWLAGPTARDGIRRRRGFGLDVALFGEDGKTAALAGTLEVGVFTQGKGPRRELSRRQVSVVEGDYRTRYQEGMFLVVPIPSYTVEWPDPVLEVTPDGGRTADPVSIELRFTAPGGKEAFHEEEGLRFDFDPSCLLTTPPEDAEALKDSEPA
jgi:HEAT repeat protein